MFWKSDFCWRSLYPPQGRKTAMDEFMSKEGVDKTWCSCTNIIWTQMMVIGLVIWTTLLTMIVLVGTCCKGSSLKQAWPYLLALLRLVLVPVRAGGRGIRRATRRMRRTPEARLIHPWWLNFKYSLWLFLCVCQMLNKVRKKTKNKKKHHKKNQKNPNKYPWFFFLTLLNIWQTHNHSEYLKSVIRGWWALPLGSSSGVARQIPHPPALTGYKTSLTRARR